MKRFLILFISIFIVNQAQQILWIRTLQPNFTWFIAHDIVTDSRNNVIGISFPYLRKYSPDGEIIWSREINFGDPNAAIGVDAGDSIIVAGYGAPAHHDTWVIMKYTPDGESLWRRIIGFHRDSVPHFSDMGIDNQNNILLTGQTEGSISSGWITFKLNPIGEIRWRRDFSSNWGPDFAEGICSDDSLNVIVGGIRGIYPIPGTWVPQVYKYSKDGDSLWAVVHFDNITYFCGVGGVTTDKFGNVILPGHYSVSYYPIATYPAFLFKHDPQGMTLWKWFDDSTARSFFSSCVTDTAGNIFTTGYKKIRFDTLAGADTVLLEVRKFAPGGEPLWVFHYFLGRYASAPNFFCRMDLDREGNIIVSVNKDSLVYIFKIIERPGILEERSEKLIPKHTFTTIVNSNQSYKISLPFNATAIEIYDISGKLKKREKINEKEYIWVSKDEKGKTLPQGIYFFKVSGKEKAQIKKIVLLK